MRIRAQAIIIENNKLVLIRDKATTKFYLPGGKTESGESIEQALAREITEETGVTLIEYTYVMTYEIMNTVYKVPQQENVFITTIKGTPKPCSEIEELRWVSLDEMSDIPLYPDVVEYIIPKLKELRLLS
jgi:8-oxo-dGTP diphosphatase